MCFSCRRRHTRCSRAWSSDVCSSALPAAGDMLLQSAASLLRSMLRDAGLVARWGGEEFILLLPDTKRDGAVAVAEKIRGAFERGERVTASFERPANLLRDRHRAKIGRAHV